MQIVTHKKGEHASFGFGFPAIWRGLPNCVAFEVEFDDTAEYIHPGGYDGLNKLFGIDATPLTPGNKGWSYMWAWRWSATRAGGGIQLFAYINKPDGSFVFQQVATIQKRQRAKLYIIPEENRVVFTADLDNSGNDFLYNYMEKPPRPLISRMIRAWFGGIYPAPHLIKMFIKRLK